MQPTIKTLPEKKLIGKHIRMSITDNKTFDLWRGFMPRRKEIKNTVGTELFSLQVYDRLFDLKNFTPGTPFEKWAAVEVSGFDEIPDGMETCTLEGGLYAVFIYKGRASEFAETFMYIFGTWLPASDYAVDDRAHFEILGDKYKNESPDSEEEVWIPVKMKN